MSQQNGEIVWGINAVDAALSEEPERVHKLLIVEGRRDRRVEGLLESARSRGIPVSFEPREALDRVTSGGNHQGAAARMAPAGYADLHELLEGASQAGRTPLLVALDNVQDPHNLGAVARSAEVLGAHGLLVPKHRSAAPGGGAEKAASGALSRIPVARVSNLARGLQALKEAGIWIVGSATEDGVPPWQIDLTVPVVLVIGGEEKGVRPVVRKVCDHIATVPQAGRTGSLNASVAAGVLLYEAFRQRSEAVHDE